MADFKLGKLPAREGAVTFAFSAFLDATKLPPVPPTFGHQDLYAAQPIGMLGNDQYGDCVWAGAAHETMLWGDEAKRTFTFTDKTVLSDYSKVTGFNPSDPSSDKGTDMSVAASYRRKTGIVDADGKRHKVAAYLALGVGNLDDVKLACYLFGAVGIGVKFPASAMDQFNKGQPWSVVPGSKIEGGHYVPLVGFDGTHFLIVTWGKLHPMDPDFLQTYMDEGIAYLSKEMLTAGKSLEGFDEAALQADLKALG